MLIKCAYTWKSWPRCSVNKSESPKTGIRKLETGTSSKESLSNNDRCSWPKRKQLKRKHIVTGENEGRESEKNWRQEVKHKSTAHCGYPQVSISCIRGKPPVAHESSNK